MNLYEKIAAVKKAALGYYPTRAAAELVYALKVSAADSGKFDDIVGAAADGLCAHLEAEGVITEAAARECETALLPVSEAAKHYRITCVGHAHIDMNWMWGFNETSAIALDTFRTVLKLMDQYPDFTFSQSQASTYRIVEEYDPEMFEKIKARVAEGRWEVTASTWVESDKNMAGGESLARQMLYTKRYFHDKFGLDGDSLSLDFEPDTFGHSACLPEILSRGGVKYYYHCRGIEGYDIYNWQAESGEKLLNYREPVWYNATITPDFIELIPEYCRKNKIDFMLKVYGVGDHGGGPTRRDIETIADMAKWPVAPTITFGTYGAFFHELETHRDNFPTVTGELNFIFTGCYSAQSRIKMANRLAETNLYTAEAASALALAFAGGKNEAPVYAKAWERTLFNQFHDILPGSGVRETREYALGRFQEAMGYAYAGRVRALTALAAHIDTSALGASEDVTSNAEGGGVGFKGSPLLNSSDAGGFNVLFPERGSGKTRILHIFNPTQYEREETTDVTVWDYPGDITLLRVTDAQGRPTAFETGETGEFWAHRFLKLKIYAKVRPFGYNTYVIGEKENDGYEVALPKDPRIEVYPERVLENEYLRAEFDDDMALVSLTDKHSGKELIRGKSACFHLSEHNHRSGTVMCGNAWVEGSATRSVNLNETEQVFIGEVKTSGALSQHIDYTIKFRRSQLHVVVELAKNSPVLKFRVACDWYEVFSPETGIPALKFTAPLGYHVKEYTYTIPFGTIERKPIAHDVPAIGLAYAPDDAGGSGAVLLSDCTYAFRGEADTLSATILRATQDPDRCPEYGLHNVVFGIAAVDGGKGPAELIRLNSGFTCPLYYFSDTAHAGSLSTENSFLHTEGAIAVSGLKSTEEPGADLIVRVSDVSRRGGRGTVVFAKPVVSAQPVDLIENPATRDDGRPVTVEKNRVGFDLKPGEILTLRVSF